MAKKSGVSWTDASHGFWYGCHHVSKGCDYCYAERMVNRAPNLPPFNQVTRRKTGFDAPLEWTPRRIFVNPWSDFFHADVPGEWRREAWEIIRLTPFHTWIILTKRPENIAAMLPDNWDEGWKQVWLGVTAENQPNANLRIPQLLKIPAKVHFASCEPLLGAIDLTRILIAKDGKTRLTSNALGFNVWDQSLKWVIAGGESGPHQKKPETARAMNMKWARALREQCRDHEVAFFFKQDSSIKAGARPYLVETDGSHTVYHQFPGEIK